VAGPRRILTGLPLIVEPSCWVVHIVAGHEIAACDEID
jgi:hypothetical protein